MEENKLKLKLSRIFTSSCKTQNLSEVIDHQNPILIHQNTSLSSPVFKPNQTPLSNYPCKPRCPQSFDHMILQNCIIPSTANPIPHRKLAGKFTLLPPSGEFSGRICPPVSPVFHRDSKQSKNKKLKKKQRSRKNCKFGKTHLRNHPFYYSSSNETDGGDWFSSDDEREDYDRETETLFSSSKSISFSSDSDPYYPTRTRPRVKSRTRKPRTRSCSGSGSGSSQAQVKDTFAVVKSSSDPYNDFRTSMVEMIMEKQIFGAKELEELLQCFLSLNSSHHHQVIVEVFTEIWDALFSYCS